MGKCERYVQTKSLACENSDKNLNKGKSELIRMPKQQGRIRGTARPTLTDGCLAGYHPKYVLQNETCVQQIKHRRGQCVLLGLGEMWMVPNYSKDDQAMLPVTGPHMQSRTTSFWKKQTWAARDFFFPLPSDTCDGFHLQKKGLVQRHCKDKAVVEGKKGWTKGNTAGALC